jgi:tungstate transport system permease protein
MIIEAIHQAAALLFALDKNLMEIVALSLQVSFSSLLISLLIGLPLGTLLAITSLPGKRLLITILNAMMGLPPVVVGLLVYLLLSRTGPLGVFGLLYTPSAMIIAQVILVTPIIASLTHQVMEDLHSEYREQFQSFGLTRTQAVKAYLWDARYTLVTAMLAGFGRAISEVGAVIIVGGNIDHLTRVMTTAIALETAKGDFSMALALGFLLLLISLIVSALVGWIRSHAKKRAYV